MSDTGGAPPSNFLAAVPRRPARLPQELLADVPWQLAAPPAPISGLAYHAGRVMPGNLFAAWRGRAADGHRFVAQAVQRGASALLLERPVALPDAPPLSVAVVPDVRASLARAAQQFYGDPTAALRCVGITGTNGKTTCACLLQAVFQAAGLPCGRIGTLGSYLGDAALPAALTTPESIDLLAQLCQMQAHGAAAVVLEASSQALAQRRLEGVACDAALFLNLTRDHLDWHGTMEAYGAAKAHLLTRLKAGGVTAFNLDDPYCAALYRRARAGGAAATPYGFSRHAATPGADVCLLDVTPQATGRLLRLRTPQGELQVHSTLLGDFNLENLLACATVGVALQLPFLAIAAGLAAVRAVPGRLEQVSQPPQPRVVVDFAHTPQAVFEALRALRSAAPGRLFCVVGCGGNRDASKRAPMGAAALRGADFVVVTSDNPRHEDPAAIAASVVQGVQDAGGMLSTTYRQHGYAVELDRRRAIALALRLCGSHDVLLIAGKGHETGQQVGEAVLPFDDRVVARDLLQLWRQAPAGSP